MMSTAKGFRLGRCSSGKRKSNFHSELEKGKRKVDRSKNKKHKKPPVEKLTKGDIVNISDLLFTKDRDYLITYNDRNHPVQAKHLEGKFIVLHFVSLAPLSVGLRQRTSSLVDVYNALLPKGVLEVIFVAVTNANAGSNPLNSTPDECFEEIFSIMPWAAIPFSDIKSLKYLERRFPISGFISYASPVSFVIDPTGVVLQCQADYLFLMYGPQSYPFSDERIAYIISEDDEARKHPSITKLLASPERDYVISNHGKQVVPVHKLEDKVVALYFCEDYPNDNLTERIQTAYEQLANKENFEIVLIYIYDTWGTFGRTNEESFWKLFNTMPWLALPFKDPNCTKLQRIFSYPVELGEPGPDPRLVIIGPQGKFVEPYAVDILKNFGVSAYPFTRKRAAELEAENVKKLKLDMFWDPNTFFITKDGSKVQLSQFVGKRIILIIEDDWVTRYAEFWRMLKARYLELKGTNDEFEVIHISYEKSGSSYGKHVATMPWLILPYFRTKSNGYKLSLRVFKHGDGLLAFDRDGSVVRRTIFPSFEREDMDFPFYAGGLEKEALMELIYRFDWDYWDDASDDDSPSNI